MRPPVLSMLFGAVVAGGGVGAISAAHYAGTTMADLAMFFTVAFSAFFSLGLGFVAIVGFAIGAAIAGKRADAAAGAAGLIGAALLGAAVLLVAALGVDGFATDGYLPPTIAALGGAVAGGAAVLLVRRPRASRHPAPSSAT